MNLQDLRFELDNLFSRYGFGEVLLENIKKDKAVWKTDEHDYVTIHVPLVQAKRFQMFWRQAKQKLGARIKPYHIQDGIPVHKGRKLKMMLMYYFIPVEAARLLLLHFYELLTPEIGDPYNWEYDYTIFTREV